MFDAIITGLVALFTPQAILFMIIGVIYGLIIGILPGLGGIVAMALLLPFSYGFETAATIALLLGAHIACVWGDSVPVVRPLMLALGPSEYLMMALWGVTIIATFSEGSLLKGMASAALGVFVAFIGMDIVTATPRFTFGIVFLLDGISFPVAMIGMFAVAEMMKLYVKGTSIVDRSIIKENST
ncbi:MAG: protein of unknown function transrane, partial [Deltaproteobacteria bacterium]|nr:protein of unknown function transrane [Deltaproteobacteria bacterium]